MPVVYGTGNNWGVPVTLQFVFNGNAVNWGSANLLSMAPLSNSAESVDGAYKISDLDVEFIDTNGSIWGSLGNGTTAFNTTFSATAYVGGTMDFSTWGPESKKRFEFQNTGNSGTFVVHNGKIVYVSKRDRVVRIRSKSNLRQLGEMEWKFPYTDEPTIADQVLGSYYFFDNKHLGTMFPNSCLESDQDNRTFEFYAAIATTAGTLSADYPPISGRGTLGRLTGYTYVGTQFYFNLPIVKVRGTFLTSKIGQIESTEEAQRYGFANLAVADAARLTNGAGPSATWYPITKTRLHINNGSVVAGSTFYLQQNVTLSETPANLFRELVAGHCVSPYFGTTDIDSDSFATAQSKTGFQSFVYKIEPKGGKVIPAIKNLLDSLYAMFSVNPENKFVFEPYAPRKIRITPESIGSSDIVDFQYANDIEDFYNRVVINYGYDPDSNEFRRNFELKSSDWTNPLDRPYIIDSKFMYNDNEAAVFANRILRRFKNTVPKFNLTTSLKFSGAPIGSLYSVSDPDSITGTKIIEVTGYSKDFTEERQVRLTGIDAEALYFQRGYAYWGTKSTLPGDTVNSNSDSGWGTGGTAGTCPGINESIHGTCFVWW